MFTVTTAATQKRLTTLAAVKTELAKTDGTDDDWLATQIDVASGVICNYLGVAMAEDGTRTLAQETLVETIDRRRYGPWTTGRRREDSIIFLSRMPATSITSITEDGVAVASTDYQLSGARGMVERLSSSTVAAWPSALVVVTYIAGWVMPNTKDASGASVTRTLPFEIEDAAIGLVKASWFARKRDPNVKSEELPGVRRVDYFFGVPGQVADMPPDVAAQLSFYRNPNV